MVHFSIQSFDPERYPMLASLKLWLSCARSPIMDGSTLLIPSPICVRLDMGKEAISGDHPGCDVPRHIPEIECIPAKGPGRHACREVPGACRRAHIDLNASGQVIGIPTPAFAEVLVKAGSHRLTWVSVLSDRYKFALLPFDSRAAIEASELIEAVKKRAKKSARRHLGKDQVRHPDRVNRQGRECDGHLCRRHWYRTAWETSTNTRLPRVRPARAYTPTRTRAANGRTRQRFADAPCWSPRRSSRERSENQAARCFEEPSRIVARKAKRYKCKARNPRAPQEHPTARHRSHRHFQGQITLPSALRSRLDIHTGSRIRFHAAAGRRL